MAKMTIGEYGGFALTSGGVSESPHEPSLASQQVTATTSSVQSAAFGSNTKLIRIEADGPLFFEVGVDPTASNTTSKRIPAGVVDYLWVQPGHKIAIIE